MRKLILLLLLSVFSATPLQAMAQDFTIGYLELKKDERYKTKRLFARFPGQALGRPFAGAEIAMKEVRFHGSDLGLSFKLEKQVANKPEDLQPTLQAMLDKGIHFVAADLPAPELATLAKAMKDQPLVLFNVSAYEDQLRGADCQANLFHTLPSQAMLYEALAQYMVSKKWRNILHLEGQLPEDQALSATFSRAAKKYGLKIIDKRVFELSNDPRQRSQNNVSLLTGGDFDAIFVADTQGEFARATPYQTQNPNLVIGSDGLTPLAWHWSWDRYGAPQLEKRFEKEHNRAMGSTDFAAWMAVKAVAEAVQGSKSSDFATLRNYMASGTSLYDNFKGTAGSFRPWNNQLRQPILLATHNWVVDRAPIDGFLHQSNTLDTLGVDERENQCQFN